MLDKAENPEKMIKLIIQEMEETLVEVRTTAAKHIAEKKTLMRQKRQLEESVANWQNKAQLAVEKQRDDLARAALAEKHKSDEQLAAINNDIAQLDEFLASVQEDSQRLQDKLSDAKRKQEAYVLRQQTAEVRLKAKEQTAVYNIDEAISKFERYQQKIDDVEAQIEAYDMTANKSLDSQFKELEQDDSIEQELEAMKKQVVNG